MTADEADDDAPLPAPPTADWILVSDANGEPHVESHRDRGPQLVVNDRPGGFDELRVVRAVREVLIGLGYDPEADGLRQTPQRVARSLREMTSGRDLDAHDILRVHLDAAGRDEVVVLRDVPFHSLCEHHLLPFHGVAHVAYLPPSGNGRKRVGLSKLARLVDAHARRLQVQERMTAGIADDLEAVLHPDGIAVVVEASHQCLHRRAARCPGATVLTWVLRGLFRDDPQHRRDILDLLRGRT